MQYTHHNVTISTALILEQNQKTIAVLLIIAFIFILTYKGIYGGGGVRRVIDMVNPRLIVYIILVGST